MISRTDYARITSKRHHKYNVAPKEQRTCDGITFDSKAEMRHYTKLVLAQKAGVVRFFLRQVPFGLPGGIKYRADFMVVFADGRLEFQDVKGFRTRDYINKCKQVRAIYGVEIVEIKN